VLKELVAEKRPRIIRHMEQEGVDLSLITFNWFLTAFVDCVPPEVRDGTKITHTAAACLTKPAFRSVRPIRPQTFYRIWDSFMYEGAKVLFRFALGILRMNEEQILQRTGTGPLFQFLRNMTSRLYNVNELAKVRCDSLRLYFQPVLTRCFSVSERAYSYVVRICGA